MECQPLENQSNLQHRLTGFSSYLWLTNKKDVLKRMLITDSFKQQTGSDLNQIDPKNQILNNLFITFQNTDEFPSDNLVLISPAETKLITFYANHYKNMYIDAFFAGKQCMILEEASKNEKYYEEFYAICYYGYTLHDKTFLLRSD